MMTSVALNIADIFLLHYGNKYIISSSSDFFMAVSQSFARYRPEVNVITAWTSDMGG